MISLKFYNFRKRENQVRDRARLQPVFVVSNGVLFKPFNLYRNICYAGICAWVIRHVLLTVSDRLGYSLVKTITLPIVLRWVIRLVLLTLSVGLLSDEYCYPPYRSALGY
jgi:hypothetical protein